MYMISYLKKKVPDCILYSEDGAQFKTHKELLGQTQFTRELLASSNCCGKIEIIFTCSKDELQQLINFVNNGKLFCLNETEFSSTIENLKKFLGFDNHSNFADNFNLVRQSKKLVDENSENVSCIKKEIDDKDFQVGMSVLDEMDETCFEKNPNSQQDMKQTLEPMKDVNFTKAYFLLHVQHVLLISSPFNFSKSTSRFQISCLSAILLSVLV